jgi:hypothetical protein
LSDTRKLPWSAPNYHKNVEWFGTESSYRDGYCAGFGGASNDARSMQDDELIYDRGYGDGATAREWVANGGNRDRLPSWASGRFVETRG